MIHLFDHQLRAAKPTPNAYSDVQRLRSNALLVFKQRARIFTKLFSFVFSRFFESATFSNTKCTTILNIVVFAKNHAFSGKNKIVVLTRNVDACSVRNTQIVNVHDFFVRFESSKIKRFSLLNSIQLDGR